jgi:hypothetical protein
VKAKKEVAILIDGIPDAVRLQFRRLCFAKGVAMVAELRSIVIPAMASPSCLRAMKEVAKKHRKSLASEKGEEE